MELNTKSQIASLKVQKTPTYVLNVNQATIWIKATAQFAATVVRTAPTQTLAPLAWPVTSRTQALAPNAQLTAPSAPTPTLAPLAWPASSKPPALATTARTTAPSAPMSTHAPLA